MTKEQLLAKKELLLKKQDLLKQKLALESKMGSTSSSVNEEPVKEESGILEKVQKFDDVVQQPVLKGFARVASLGKAAEDLDGDGRISGSEALDQNIIKRGEQGLVNALSGGAKAIGLDGVSEGIDKYGNKAIDAQQAVVGAGLDFMAPGSVDVATLGAGKIYKAGKAVFKGVKNIDPKSVKKVAKYLSKDINEFERAKDATTSNISGKTRLFDDAQILLENNVFDGARSSKDVMNNIRKLESNAVSKVKSIIKSVPDDVGFRLDNTKIMDDLSKQGVNVESVDELQSLLGSASMSKSTMLKIINGDEISVKDAQLIKQKLYARAGKNYNASSTIDKDQVTAIKSIARSLKEGIEGAVPDATELIENNKILSAVIEHGDSLGKKRSKDEVSLFKDLNPLNVAKRVANTQFSDTHNLTRSLSTQGTELSSGAYGVASGAGMLIRGERESSALVNYMQNPVFAQHEAQYPGSVSGQAEALFSNYKMNSRSTESTKELLQGPMADIVKQNLPEEVSHLVEKMEAGIDLPAAQKNLVVKSMTSTFPEFYEYSQYESLVDGKITDPYEVGVEKERIMSDDGLSNIDKFKRTNALNKDGTLLTPANTAKGTVKPADQGTKAEVGNFLNVAKGMMNGEG